MKMHARVRFGLLAIPAMLAILLSPIGGVVAAGTTLVIGQVLDAQGGLPVSNATVELDRGDTKIATTTSDAGGAFAFHDVEAGTYSFLIRANGYQTTRGTQLTIAGGQPLAQIQIAINSGTLGLKQIATVAVSARGGLQTATTINTHVDTSVIQDENFGRLGDVLTTVPGVLTSTSSSVGDDMSLSIRGFDSSETATLLDGHPIGPIGAFGGGYNYNVSPFFGLSGVDVIFGSGATGLYGATSMAGAVNFQTINPTQQPHFSISQGVGTSEKLMSGFLATGTVGHLGYAFAEATQGTYGNFLPGVRLQTAFLQGSAIPAHQPTAPPSGAPAYPQPADITMQNRESNINAYNVAGTYKQQDFVGKLTYDFSPRSSLWLTAYSANDWSDSSGEGDNDYQTYAYTLYNARNAIAGFGGTETTKLNNGKTYTCKNTLIVLVDYGNGAQCMTASQYALNTYGPFGGGYDRWRTLGNQDYAAHFSQGIGMSTFTVDGYADAYNYNEQKGPGAAGGPFYTYLYKTHGVLLSDEFAWAKNDLAFGWGDLHQTQGGTTLPYVGPAGNTYNNFTAFPGLSLTTSSYFLRDQYSPNLKFSAFANLWLQRSYNTATTQFNPRLSLVYRPDGADVVRVTGGRAFSEPDPSLIFQTTTVSFGAPTSLNPVCGAGNLNTVAGVANPDLKPETATDVEVSVGHRFTPRTTFQISAYNSNEQNALLSGNVPVTSIPQIPVPGSFLAGYLHRIQQVCGGTPTIADLGYSTTYNAAQAHYKGINMGATVGIVPNVSFNASYNIQSAYYMGIPNDILQQNFTLINGTQFNGVPLRQGTAGLSYQNRAGVAARFDANYIGAPNSWNRNPFWFANASVSKTTGQVTVNLGMYNVFNSVSQQYGLIGYGVYRPENQYGTDVNAYQQGSEQYGLPFRSTWLSVKFGI